MASFRGLQQRLIDSYAWRVSALWHEWAANLHKQDVLAISNGQWEERPDGQLGTMAPVALPSVLNLHALVTATAGAAGQPRGPRWSGGIIGLPSAPLWHAWAVWAVVTVALLACVVASCNRHMMEGPGTSRLSARFICHMTSYDVI